VLALIESTWQEESAIIYPKRSSNLDSQSWRVGERAWHTLPLYDSHKECENGGVGQYVDNRPY